MVPGMTGDQLVGLVAVIVFFIILMGSMDHYTPRRSPPNVDDAAITAKLLAPHAEVTVRRCYCPEGRWARWRDGVAAGPDHVLHTPDDVDPEQAKKEGADQ